MLETSIMAAHPGESMKKGAPGERFVRTYRYALPNRHNRHWGYQAEKRYDGRDRARSCCSSQAASSASSGGASGLV